MSQRGLGRGVQVVLHVQGREKPVSVHTGSHAVSRVGHGVQEVQHTQVGLIFLVVTVMFYS